MNSKNAKINDSTTDLAIPSQSISSKLSRCLARPAEGVAVPAKVSSGKALETRPSREPGGKTTTVIALLERKEGASLAEFIAATGWLPHSTRAALTGLRKKGHTVERSKRGNDT